MLEAMVYLMGKGMPWRDLPTHFGKWKSVYTRWRRWCRSGLWAAILKCLARRAKGKLRFIDASHIKVHQDASNPAGGQSNQAIGRTKGGLNTKLSALVDNDGHTLWLSLEAGQRADVKAAQPVIEHLQSGQHLVGDKGYDSDELRGEAEEKGVRTCLASRKNRKEKREFNRGYYRKRHRVENFFGRIKRARRVGTRYEKLDLHFLGFVQLAAILDWLN